MIFKSLLSSLYSMIKYFCLFFLALMTTMTLSGQSGSYMFNQKSFSTSDGLSSRFVQDIYQDSRYYIWVSTDYGINRFDGDKFKKYNQAKFKLQTDNIKKIQEDQQGNLWLINNINVHKNNVLYWVKTTIDILQFAEDDIISLEEYVMNDLPFKLSSVTRIEQDESFVLWISTNEGRLFKYTDHFVEVPISTDLMAGAVLIPLRNAEFLILGPGKISKLDKDFNLIFQTNFKEEVLNVIKGKGNRIFIIPKGSNRIPYEISPEGKIDLFFKEDSEDSNEKTGVLRISLDAMNRLWVEGRDNTLTLYDKNDEEIEEESLYRVELPPNFNNNYMLYADKSGGMWYVDREGLNYMSLNKSGFTTFMGQRNISMRALFKMTDSTFFVNTYSGYMDLNIKNGYFESYNLPGFTNFSKSGILFDGYIYNSMYSPKVIKIDLENEMIEYVKMNGPKTLNPKIFIQSPDSMLLIGANSGLFMLNPKIDSISPYHLYNEFEDLENRIINNFNQIDNQVFISTDDGLFVLDWEKGIVAHHKFIFNHLLYLYQDQDGIRWIATRGGGILEWNIAENTTHQYTVDDGLSHDILFAIYEDTTNQLWLPSNKGLVCFDKKSKTIVNYFEANGISDNEFNQYAHFQDIDGTIYVGGVDGMVRFHPTSFLSPEKISTKDKIVVTDINVTQTDNKVYDLPINTINAGETLVIKGNVIATNIKFSLLEYDRLESSQYAYKIEGIHDVWQPMDDQYVRLTGLYGGFHDISIKVHAGIKMKAYYHTIKVEIRKPFTHTWPFFALCALGFLALGISLSRYRIYRLDKINRSLERKVVRRTQKIEDDRILISQQYQEMEQINKTKDHLIAIIGHDLKDYVSTFEGIEQKMNYLISSKQVERIPHLAEFIENSAHDLSLLLDNLLNWALKERGDLLLHPDSVNVNSILKDVLKRIEKSFAKKEIVLISKIPEDLSIYVDGLTLHSLLRNIIHNAIKFSHRKGEVKVYHTEEEDFVTLHIEDHGIGMTNEQIERVLTGTNAAASTRGTENEAGTGMGLLLCREMLEMQLGNMNISSELGAGTTFGIVLPKHTLIDEQEKIDV